MARDLLPEYPEDRRRRCLLDPTLGKEVSLKKIALLAWMALTLGLAACNTMRGAGEDVEATGEGVQDAAEDTEEELEDEGRM